MRGMRNRLAKLEAVVDPDAVAGLQAERRRWERALARLYDLVGLKDGPHMAAVAAFWVAEFGWAEAFDGHGRGEWQRRVPDALLLVVTRVADPAFARRLLTPAGPEAPGRRGPGFPVQGLCLSLAQLRERLPADLKSATLRAVLEAGVLADRPCDPGSVGGRMVCTACGLGVPVRPLPSLREMMRETEAFVQAHGRAPEPADWRSRDPFPGCPHCGGTCRDWPHLTDQNTYPWRKLAEAELAAAATP